MITKGSDILIYVLSTMNLESKIWRYSVVVLSWAPIKSKLKTDTCVAKIKFIMYIPHISYIKE